MAGGFEQFASQAAQFAGGPQGAMVGMGIQALAGVAQLARGAKLNKEADRIAGTIRDVRYDIPRPVLDNQALAETRAMQGLSDAAMLAYENGVDRSMTTSIDAVLRGGGSVNSISELFDSAADKYENLALIEEELRLKNVQNLQSQNERLADELTTQWQVNEWAPNEDKKAAVRELRASATQQQQAGFNTALSAPANYIAGQQYAASARYYGQGGANTYGSGPQPVARVTQVANPYLRALKGLSATPSINSGVQAHPYSSEFMGNDPYSGVNLYDEGDNYKYGGTQWP
jgi:hypothetical protein